MAGEQPRKRDPAIPGSAADFDTSVVSPEEADLEQYGVWVKAGPQDVGENDIDLESLPATEDLDESSLTEEEEELLGSLESDAESDSPQETEDSEVPSLSDFDDDFSFDLREESVAPDDLPDATPAKATDPRKQAVRPAERRAPPAPVESIDDISAFEADLADSNDEEEGSMAIPEASDSILKKIERDLLSIKDELASLKSEISSLRGGGLAVQTEEKKEKLDEASLLGEDEDETIALTGDELDNILNTADITEETGEPSLVPEENDLLIDEISDDDDSAGRLIDRDNIIEIEEELSPLAPEALHDADEDLNFPDPEEEIALDDLPADPSETLEDVEIELPDAEPLVAEEELPDLQLEDDADLQAADLNLDDEFNLSESEQEAIEIEPEEFDGGDSTVEELDEIDLTEPEPEPEPVRPRQEPVQAKAAPRKSPLPEADGDGDLSEDLKVEIKSILRYMDQLLESLPEEKIEEFARSEYFEVYKKLFDDLGLTT